MDAYDPSPVFKQIWTEYTEETGEKVSPDVRDAVKDAYLDYAGDVENEDEALCLRDVIPTYLSLIQYGEERAKRGKPSIMAVSDGQPGAESDHPVKRTYPKNQKRQMAILEFVALRSISKESIAEGKFPGKANWDTLAMQWNTESPQRPLSAEGLRRAYFRAKKNEEACWALREKYEKFYPWPDFGFIHAMRQSAALYQAQMTLQAITKAPMPVFDMQNQFNVGMGISAALQRSFGKLGLMPFAYGIEQQLATPSPFTTLSSSLMEAFSRHAVALGIDISDELDAEVGYDTDETDEEHAARVRKARNRAIARKAKARLEEIRQMKQHGETNSFSEHE